MDGEILPQMERLGSGKTGGDRNDDVAWGDGGRGFVPSVGILTLAHNCEIPGLKSPPLFWIFETERHIQWETVLNRLVTHLIWQMDPRKKGRRLAFCLSLNCY